MCMTRILSITATVTLLAIAAPPAGARSGQCKPFEPGVPDTSSAQTDEVLEGPVLRVGDHHTAKRPLKVRFEQGRNLWWLDPISGGWHAVIEDTVFHNIQVVSRHARSALNVRIQWPTPSASDLDLGLYDGHGTNLVWSGAFNNLVLDTAYTQAFGPYSGGEGYEEILEWPARRCEGFTTETWSMHTSGERITMTIWIGTSDE